MPDLGKCMNSRWGIRWPAPPRGTGVFLGPISLERVSFDVESLLEYIGQLRSSLEAGFRERSDKGGGTAEAEKETKMYWNMDCNTRIMI